MSALLPVETHDLERYEAVIASGLQTFIEVGTALMEIRDRKLYRAEFGTFEGYCRERWNLTDRRARQLMSAADVVSNIETGTTVPKPETERQARPLARLEPPQQRIAWERAIETAPGGKVTAKHVESVVSEMTGPAERTERKAEINGMFAAHAPLPDQSSFIEEPDEEDPTPEARPVRQPYETLQKLLKDLYTLLGSVNASHEAYGWGGFADVIAGAPPGKRREIRNDLNHFIESFQGWVNQIQE